MSRIDQEPNPFRYIGGQPKAVETLLAAVAQERMVELRWTPRAMTNFLRYAISLREQKTPQQLIDTSFLMALMPRTKRLGFDTSRITT